jgi:hypothetical protein
MAGMKVQAQYDGATIHGPWGYMCNQHFAAYGVGLGTGRGQFLIVGERPSPVPRAKGPSEDPVPDDLDEGEIPPVNPEKEEAPPVKMDWGNV